MSGLVLAILRFTLLPLRAPWLLFLWVVSVYLGMHWVVQAPALISSWPVPSLDHAYQLYWSIEFLQALLVVVVASMPDLLLRQLSLLMAVSRVITLIITLLLVTIIGLYLLHLRILADAVILASGVLLARLDLVRIRVVPPPLVTALALSAYVLLGIWLGRWLQVEGVWRPGPF